MAMILLFNTKATNSGNTLNIFIGHLDWGKRKKREWGGEWLGRGEKEEGWFKNVNRS